MIVHFSVHSFRARLMTGLLTLTVFSVLVFAGLWYVIIGTLTDDRIAIPREVLNAGAHYFPTSPRLQARLAMAEMQGPERKLEKAETHLRQALALLPKEYTFHLQLGSLLEAEGKPENAEASYREALRLAPNYLEVHWRLANNLVRQGKVKESLEYFRYATGRNLMLLANAYDLIWTVSGGSIDDITHITSDSPKAQLALAEFLVKQARYAEAADVCRRLERNVRRSEPTSAAILNALLEAKQVSLARELWGDMLQTDASKSQPLIWNGSFEDEINPAFAQFDWTLKDNEYARVGIDPQNARTGRQSLRIAFLGKDTARLDGEVKQLLLVKPGKRYRLEYQYKIRELTTPMGPRVAIIEYPSQTVLVASEPLPEGSHAWQGASLEFTVPAQTLAVVLQVQRIPKYSYDDPTRGYIWFDDFVLKEW